MKSHKKGVLWLDSDHVVAHCCLAKNCGRINEQNIQHKGEITKTMVMIFSDINDCL